MKRLVIAEIARADLTSIRRYSTRTWGPGADRQVHECLQDCLKALTRGTEFTRSRDDLWPRIRMATSGRHSIFFETDDAQVLVVRVLHQSMDYRRHLGATGEAADETN
ncbi:Toxin ParE1 [Luteitalea pratensis]|uniref:Toxin ParE1 n=1 Tax=Luteitalea pratensis TaxID=1855912 RepID=A0A143PSC8_LUTPR|nr:Toxin ParE1 [Luteitalea pratensis]